MRTHHRPSSRPASRRAVRAAALVAALVTASLTSTLVAHSLEAGAGKVSTSRTTVGRPVTFIASTEGDLTGASVTLQRLATGNVWVDAGPATATGSTAEAIAPTGYYASHTLRIHADLADGSTFDSAPATVRVVPAHKPAGRAAQHSLISPSGDVVMWDSCTDISYRVNTSQAPRGALRDVKRAFRRVSEGTGLTFRYRGTSAEVPDPTNPWVEHTDADVLVAWRSPTQDRHLGGALGYGGPVYRSGYETPAGMPIMLADQGMVVLSTRHDHRLRPGFGAGATRGKLLMHEIGHVVGLGHAPDRTQVMYPSVQRDHGRFWGAGDIAGFAKVGAHNGCVAAADAFFSSLAMPRVTISH